MERVARRIALWLTCAALLGACAAEAATPSKASHERLVAALAETDFGNVYFEDGMCDGTITDEAVLAARSKPEAGARVKAILELKQAAIPLLIRHLDDVRPTKVQFKGKHVLLGHMALDILTHIIGRNPLVLDLENTDDGLGAGIQLGYYFRPDATPAEMQAVRKKWEKLARRGAIRFEGLQ